MISDEEYYCNTESPQITRFICNSELKYNNLRNKCVFYYSSK